MNIRTDLAVESNIDNCIKVNRENIGKILKTTVKIETDDAAERLGKPKGLYVTLKCNDILNDTECYECAISEIANTLKSMLSLDGNVLVAGLGNRQITPDSLGPDTIDRLFVTNHLKKQLKYDFVEKFGRVSAISPGVLGTTGIESFDIIKGVCKELKPDSVILVDAFCAAEKENLATTIQLSDTGLSPGGGVKNRRAEISKNTLGVPVIAIGVPTVIDSERYDILESDSLYLTPKDIDILIDRMSKTIANGINKAVHKNLTMEEIESYIG